MKALLVVLTVLVLLLAPIFQGSAILGPSVALASLGSEIVDCCTHDGWWICCWIMEIFIENGWT